MAVGLAGWYGHGNIGDELILERLLSLCAAVSSVHGLAVTDRAGAVWQTRALRHGGYWRSRPPLSCSPVRLAQWFRTRAVGMMQMHACLDAVDAWVVGGGTQSGDTAEDLEMRLAPLRLAHRSGRPLALYGVGFAQARSRRVTRLVREMAALADLVLVRDAHSYGLFADACDCARVVAAADPLYVLWEGSHQLPWSGSTGKNGGTVVVCPRDHRGDPAYRRGLVAGLSRLVTRLCRRGQEVRLLPLWHEDDPQLCRQIAEDAKPSTAATVAPVPRSLAEFRAATADAAVVAAMPLHGTLLAVMSGRPVVSVCYHRKCTLAVGELGLGAMSVGVTADGAVDDTEVGQRIERAPAWYASQGEQIALRLDGLRQQAQEGEALFCGWLAGLHRVRSSRPGAA